MQFIYVDIVVLHINKLHISIFILHWKAVLAHMFSWRHVYLPLKGNWTYLCYGIFIHEIVQSVIALWYMILNKAHNISNGYQIFFKCTCMWNKLISNTQIRSPINVYLMILMLEYCEINFIRGCHCSWVIQARWDIIAWVNNLLHYILRWFITLVYFIGRKYLGMDNPWKPQIFPYEQWWLHKIIFLMSI